ncbi:hypothetical protein G9A89_008352 [Geosiphon pyriformis]|nr:hypothetical protein G9A89_008352 [Geosiphon pyriformis]
MVISRCKSDNDNTHESLRQRVSESCTRPHRYGRGVSFAHGPIGLRDIANPLWNGFSFVRGLIEICHTDMAGSHFCPWTIRDTANPLWSGCLGRLANRATTVSFVRGLIENSLFVRGLIEQPHSLFCPWVNRECHTDMAGSLFLSAVSSPWANRATTQSLCPWVNREFHTDMAVILFLPVGKSSNHTVSFCPWVNRECHTDMAGSLFSRGLIEQPHSLFVPTTQSLCPWVNREFHTDMAVILFLPVGKSSNHTVSLSVATTQSLCPWVNREFHTDMAVILFLPQLHSLFCPLVNRECHTDMAGSLFSPWANRAATQQSLFVRGLIEQLHSLFCPLVNRECHTDMAGISFVRGLIENVTLIWQAVSFCPWANRATTQSFCPWVNRECHTDMAGSLFSPWANRATTVSFCPWANRATTQSLFVRGLIENVTLIWQAVSSPWANRATTQSLFVRGLIEICHTDMAVILFLPVGKSSNHTVSFCPQSLFVRGLIEQLHSLFCPLVNRECHTDMAGSLFSPWANRATTQSLFVRGLIENVTLIWQAVSFCPWANRATTVSFCPWVNRECHTDMAGSLFSPWANRAATQSLLSQKKTVGRYDDDEEDIISVPISASSSSIGSVLEKYCAKRTTSKFDPARSYILDLTPTSKIIKEFTSYQWAKILANRRTGASRYFHEIQQVNKLFGPIGIQRATLTLTLARRRWKELHNLPAPPHDNGFSYSEDQWEKILWWAGRAIGQFHYAFKVVKNPLESQCDETEWMGDYIVPLLQGALKLNGLCRVRRNQDEDVLTATALRAHLADLLCMYENQELCLLACGGPYNADITKLVADEFQLQRMMKDMLDALHHKFHIAQVDTIGLYVIGIQDLRDGKAGCVLFPPPQDSFSFLDFHVFSQLEGSPPIGLGSAGRLCETAETPPPNLFKAEKTIDTPHKAKKSRTPKGDN